LLLFSFPSFGRPKFRADGLLSQTIKKHLLLLLLLLVFLRVKSANKQQQNRFISFGPVRPPLTVQTQDGRTPQVADARAGRKNFFPCIYLLIIIIKLLLLLLLGFFGAGASIFSTHPLSDKDGVKGIPPSLIFPILFLRHYEEKMSFSSSSSKLDIKLYVMIIILGHQKKNSFRLFPTNI
jgi:hypothetical protein